VPFGHIVDPFGDPVRRAFALLPAASRQGRAMDFVTAYLRAAWADGVDITGEAGLRQVASSAGIHWEDAVNAAGDADWETPLTENLNDMLGAGLWGVPSFRVSGGADPEPFACWGQDRIWRVEQEIARRMM
jgi:2-hydroxychromene-2-carboxylate isomerase